MGTTSRTLVAQIALGAAFGTALAWKTARVRRPGRTGGEAPRVAGMGLAAELPGPYGPTMPTPAAAAPSLRTMHASAAATAPANPHPASPQERARALSSSIADSVRRLPEPLMFALVIAVAALIPVIIGLAYVMTRTDSTPTQAQAVASAPAHVAAPAVATPALADQLLDARRELDLGSALDAANAYATLFGAYPSTNNQLATLCANPTDVGCGITKYATNLSVSDGRLPYWYASDGRSLTLLARVQTAPAQNDCPSTLPPALAGVPVFCLRGTIGTQ